MFREVLRYLKQNFGTAYTERPRTFRSRVIEQGDARTDLAAVESIEHYIKSRGDDPHSRTLLSVLHHGRTNVESRIAATGRAGGISQERTDRRVKSVREHASTADISEIHEEILGSMADTAKKLRRYRRPDNLDRLL